MLFFIARGRHWIGVCLIMLCSALASAQSSVTPPATADFTTIKHFIFIVKENRSFDNYFGTFEPPPYGATTGLLSTGQVIPLGHTPDVTPRDLAHDWPSSLVAVDGGKMDGFDQINPGNAFSACTLNNDLLCYTQMTQQDIPNYWSYAQHFTLSDMNFSSIHAESFPAHLYTVAAQSGGVISNPTNHGVGCDTPSATVVVIDDQGKVSNQFPCFTFSSLADTLSAAGVSWRYYAVGESIWNPLDAISSVRQTPLWSNVKPASQFITDATSGNLPSVSWLVTAATQMEHPGQSVCNGENWTV